MNVILFQVTYCKVILEQGREVSRNRNARCVIAYDLMEEDDWEEDEDDFLSAAEPDLYEMKERIQQSLVVYGPEVGAVYHIELIGQYYDYLPEGITIDFTINHTGTLTEGYE